MPPANPVLADAITAHQSGRLDEAAAGYKRVLRKRPGDADALHFYGLLHFHRGDAVEAVKLIRRSLAYAPGNPHAWNNLGNILVSMPDQSIEAQEAYRRVTQLAPTMAEVWYNLGICLQDAGDLQAALEHFRTALRHQPGFLRGYETLGRLLYRLGDFQAAAEVYSQWTQRDPDNAVARHMAAASAGVNVPQRADDRYVADLFDRFASFFDENLQRLRYRAPELVAAALADHLGTSSAQLQVLDAGCGTGLCGPLLRPMCSRLVGVDLSSKMIDKARQRGGYEELAVAELCAFMRSRPAEFEAVVSADTLVYFGALEEACQAAHGTLRPQGLLVFTVELLPPDSTEPHKLHVHGRYAHSEPYVRQALTDAGFEIVKLRREALRMERLEEVAGLLVLARKA